MASPDIYDQLAKEPLSDLTVTQLNSGSKVTAIDQATIDYWRGPITLARIMQSSRTYSHGIVIPESGQVTAEAVGAGASILFQPSGTEVWQVIGLQVTADAGTPTIAIYLTDGSTPCLMHSGSSSTSPSSFFPFEAPFTISNTLYLSVINMDGANSATVTIAYSKVSL